MKHSFFRWLVTSAAFGLLAPIGWFLIQRVVDGNTQLRIEIADPAERVVRVIWPSSFWLMATDGIEGTPKAYLFTFLSVVANSVLYVILGSACWSVKQLAATPKR